MKFNIKLEDIINQSFDEEVETYCNWNDYVVRKIVDDSTYSKLLKYDIVSSSSKKPRSTKKRPRSTNQRRTIKNSRGHAIF